MNFVLIQLIKLVLLVGMSNLGLGCQPVSSEHTPQTLHTFSTTLPNEVFSKIISDYQVKIDVHFNGERFDDLAISSQESRYYPIYVAVLDTFINWDTTLRMIVGNSRLESLRNDDFVELKFFPPLSMNEFKEGILFRVSNVIVPLSDVEAMPEWNFYYREADIKGWFALRWTQPDSSNLSSIRQLAQQLF